MIFFKWLVYGHEHEWTKWEIIGELTQDGKQCGLAVQQRRCKTCGYTERKPTSGHILS